MGTKDIEANAGELCITFIEWEDHLFKSEVTELVVFDEVTKTFIDDRSISSKIGSADNTIVVFRATTTSIECPVTTTFFLVSDNTTNTLKEGGTCTKIIKMKHDGVELVVRT